MPSDNLSFGIGAVATQTGEAASTSSPQQASVIRFEEKFSSQEKNKALWMMLTDWHNYWINYIHSYLPLYEKELKKVFPCAFI